MNKLMENNVQFVFCIGNNKHPIEFIVAHKFNEKAK